MNFLGSGIDGIKIKASVDAQSTYQIIALRQIKQGKYQPRNRQHFSEESLKELTASIQEQGILQPIIVKATGSESYEIIAGERRYLAALQARFLEIPAIVKTIEEKEAYAMALAENLQRDQLTPLEQAEALFRFKENTVITIEEIARSIGKPRTTVANLIRVSCLASPKAKALCEKGFIDFGHIKAVLTLEHPLQDKVLDYVVAHQLTVRATENLITSKRFEESVASGARQTKDISEDLIRVYQTRLASRFACPVTLKQGNKGKIKVYLEFDSLEKMDTCLTGSSALSAESDKANTGIK